ncbi:DNA polymerase III subunit delta [Flavobacterium orientale]|uniref:DNA polymerase III subunit delta n=1 Tax=Flavobacterium orientale TaxID=1756020 RepID=A0A916Y568_9FLAO|nr:DNA polymerase III subunit delta [Flavobacterium orientale]GGD31039.1 DNA polymerase III subunit delta [Flavobacterium orientale]
MDEVIGIINDIKQKKFKPVYFLMGEEPYYIDKISEFIESSILSEEERGFNQMVLYGRDVSVQDIISNAKRYPMMADYQVIMVKEAQDLSRTIDDLLSYVENPQPTTILVFAYKYKTLDKRKSLAKSLQKNGLLFESKKLYDNQVGSWIVRILKGKGYAIEPKASEMLVEFLGTDLNKINNELEKLQIILPVGTTITANHIEENIGFSKDFNVFELRKAIGSKAIFQAYKIADHFAQNKKEYPMVLTTGQVFAFFVKLLQYHGLNDKSATNVAKVLAVSPFFVQEYITAAKNYPMKKVSNIVSSLRDIDSKSKGVGANQMHEADLLKEMLIKIFN